jgi:hypothetical protein
VEDLVEEVVCFVLVDFVEDDVVLVDFVDVEELPVDVLTEEDGAGQE